MSMHHATYRSSSSNVNKNPNHPYGSSGQRYMCLKRVQVPRRGVAAAPSIPARFDGMYALGIR